MLAKLLEHRPGVDSRREIGVTKEEFLIGRGPDCDLRLAVPAVSRHHCLLRVRGGEATLTDLGSVNGTFVNGQRVRSSMALQHGDEIALGDFRFVVELVTQSGINWGPDAATADQQTPTFKIQDFQKAMQKEEPKKDEGHPPGEAGGL